jgi:hypothetical protein
MRTLGLRRVVGRLIAAALAVAVVASAFAVTVLPRRPVAGSAEWAADLVLRDLRRGKVDRAFARVQPAGFTSESRAREHQHRLRYWWLVSAKSTDGEQRLEYRALRGYLPLPSPVWITVKNGRDRWVVTGYDAWY